MVGDGWTNLEYFLNQLAGDYQNTSELVGVDFAQPLDGQVFDAGVNLDVVVDADDPDGSVAEVKLYLDGQFVRRERVSPYEWPASKDAVFQNMAPGTYTLTAVATDDLGATAQASASITVDVALVP